MERKIFIWGGAARCANYAAALAAAGARPVFRADEAAECGGMLLSGGGDVEPWRYGQSNLSSTGLEPERDAAELDLIRRFSGERKPILGICRGMQVLNVAFGGTLCQDIPGHGGLADGTDRFHMTRTGPGPLGELYGAACVVNSAHHQAVAVLGSGLRPVQWAQDGTVEALCHDALPVWGVQWHPERLRGALARPGAVDGTRLFARWLCLLDENQ